MGVVFFPNLQFCFCKGPGTCDAFLTITNYVQEAMDCGCEVCMVGLDFSAAFYHVNHKALIFKLRVLVALFLASQLNFYQIDCRGLLLMANLKSTEMLFQLYCREV